MYNILEKKYQVLNKLIYVSIQANLTTVFKKKICFTQFYEMGISFNLEQKSFFHD